MLKGSVKLYFKSMLAATLAVLMIAALFTGIVIADNAYYRARGQTEGTYCEYDKSTQILHLRVFGYSTYFHLSECINEPHAVILPEYGGTPVIGLAFFIVNNISRISNFGCKLRRFMIE